MASEHTGSHERLANRTNLLTDAPESIDGIRAWCHANDLIRPDVPRHALAPLPFGFCGLLACTAICPATP